jgi:hypothetical protein
MDNLIIVSCKYERGTCMYQKIKNSLFFPRELATSYKGKVIGFIIFLIICVSLPFILNICVNGIITSKDVRNVHFFKTKHFPKQRRDLNGVVHRKSNKIQRT